MVVPFGRFDSDVPADSYCVDKIDES